MNIKEITKLTTLTSRTLRVWEEAELLFPERLENGYRNYSSLDLTRIFYIMSLRELNLPLLEIKKILSQVKDERSVLLEHLSKLKKEQERLSLLITQLTNKVKKGEYQMTDKDFDYLKKKKLAENEEKYGKEIRESYGEEAVEASNKKFLKMSKEEMEWAEKTHETIVDLLNDAFPLKDEVKGQEAVKLHREWLTHWWPKGKLTAESHQNLIQMYIEDPRFRKNYDRDYEEVVEFFKEQADLYYKK
ncbi:MAG: MerR family transcriptional regulator [Lactovum sp.]